MSNGDSQINGYVEQSDSHPQRTRPTDKQMGLGTHNLITDNSKKKKNHQSGT